MRCLRENGRWWIRFVFFYCFSPTLIYVAVSNFGLKVIRIVMEHIFRKLEAETMSRHRRLTCFKIWKIFLVFKSKIFKKSLANFLSQFSKCSAFLIYLLGFFFICSIGLLVNQYEITASLIWPQNSDAGHRKVIKRHNLSLFLTLSNVSRNTITKHLKLIRMDFF